MDAPTIIIKPDSGDVILELGRIIKQLTIASAAAGEKYFNVGVSGGSLIGMLVDALQQNPNIDYARWKVFFCDERVVPVDDADSTYGMYLKDFADKVPITEEQFVPITQGISTEEAATDYIQKMEEHFGRGKMPVFNLLLLGVGPDGHTCSLFPNHEVLNEKEDWVAPIVDSPKPPKDRITLTLPLVNNAKACIFAISGRTKAEIIKRILKDKERLPAGLVQPKKGRVYWILDQPAASLLATGNN